VRTQAPSRSLSAWLLRPYLDLGPLAEGPLHARRVEECWNAFSDADAPYFVAQRTLLPSFRSGLIEEAASEAHAVKDPRQLPGRLRTERWQALCDALDDWTRLSPRRRVRLLALLHALCLYECVAQCVAGNEPTSDDAWNTELSFWGAFASYLLTMPAGTPQHPGADTSVFEAIALGPGEPSLARFNAAMRVFVHRVKAGDPHGDLAHWATRLERALSDAVSRCNDFTAEMLTSRFYRAFGFIPQREGNRPETVRIMDLAERHALAVEPLNDAEDLLYRENLHALMESRTKEALWLGEKDLALARSLKVIEVDPYDSKAWAEIGQVRMIREEWHHAAEAYATAAMLGPPASAIARHMAGTCLQKLGHGMAAALMFKDALEIDPAGISPREALSKVDDEALRGALASWMASTAEL